jgi:hypothetical protein
MFKSVHVLDCDPFVHVPHPPHDQFSVHVFVHDCDTGGLFKFVPQELVSEHDRVWLPWEHWLQLPHDHVSVHCPTVHDCDSGGRFAALPHVLPSTHVLVCAPPKHDDQLPHDQSSTHVFGLQMPQSLEHVPHVSPASQRLLPQTAGVTHERTVTGLSFVVPHAFASTHDLACSPCAHTDHSAHDHISSHTGAGVGMRTLNMNHARPPASTTAPRM